MDVLLVTVVQTMRILSDEDAETLYIPAAAHGSTQHDPPYRAKLVTPLYFPRTMGSSQYPVHHHCYWAPMMEQVLFPELESE